ncbi:MAG TPA: hypothetical protein VMH91_03150 [Candidatus Paceibacterota bacterium]|nr:hypothetical protein [Candidatus Paceibacterota bacterium]
MDRKGSLFGYDRNEYRTGIEIDPEGVSELKKLGKDFAVAVGKLIRACAHFAAFIPV